MEWKFIQGSGWVVGYHNALIRREIEVESKRCAAITPRYEIWSTPRNPSSRGCLMAVIGDQSKAHEALRYFVGKYPGDDFIISEITGG